MDFLLHWIHCQLLCLCGSFCPLKAVVAVRENVFTFRSRCFAVSLLPGSVLPVSQPLIRCEQKVKLSILQNSSCYFYQHLVMNKHPWPTSTGCDNTPLCLTDSSLLQVHIPKRNFQNLAGFLRCFLGKSYPVFLSSGVISVLRLYFIHEVASWQNTVAMMHLLG